MKDVSGGIQFAESSFDLLAEVDTAISACSFVRSFAKACLSSAIQISAPLLCASASGIWSYPALDAVAELNNDHIM